MTDHLTKVAQDLQFAMGLTPDEESLVHKRTESAAKLRHLPPELAYALTGDLPLTNSPGANVELQKALEMTKDPSRSKLTGLAYGLPAAAAGALLANLVSGGDTAATLGGAAVAGGGVGYMAHRGEQAKQQRMGGNLARLRGQYDQARSFAVQQAMQAMEQQTMADELERALGSLQQQQGRGGQRYLPMPKAADIQMSVGPFFDASDPKRGKVPTKSLPPDPVETEDPNRGYAGEKYGEMFGELPILEITPEMRQSIHDIAYGMRKQANPGIDLKELSPEQAQALWAQMEQQREGFFDPMDEPIQSMDQLKDIAKRMGHIEEVGARSGAARALLGGAAPIAAGAGIGALAGSQLADRPGLGALLGMLTGLPFAVPAARAAAGTVGGRTEKRNLEGALAVIRRMQGKEAQAMPGGKGSGNGMGVTGAPTPPKMDNMGVGAPRQTAPAGTGLVDTPKPATTPPGMTRAVIGNQPKPKNTVLNPTSNVAAGVVPPQPPKFSGM